MGEDILDRRLNAFRPDLADIRLEGHVDATRFVDGTMRRVAIGSTPLRRKPEPQAAWDTELLRGEAVRVFDAEGDWVWVQNETDGYVGYCAGDALGAVSPEPTHRVTALRTFVYPDADMKLPAVGSLSLGAAVALDDDEVETRGTRFRRLAGGDGAVVAAHVLPSGAASSVDDFVTVAERFIETPYLWGGRTSLGLDCSALVQLSLMMAGIAAPRDTDLQEKQLGQPVADGVGTALVRGDLVFWPGHVAIMIDHRRIVHASGHQMAVVVEPLTAAIARIAATGAPPSSVRRLQAANRAR